GGGRGRPIDRSDPHRGGRLGARRGSAERSEQHSEGECPMNQSTLTTVRRTLLPFLTGLLCGCVAEPRLEPPPRCSTRFPATTAVWTFAREQTKAQAVACFDWSGAETTSAQAAQGALRVALVCPLVPVTP